jgi:hypothetical protein
MPGPEHAAAGGGAEPSIADLVNEVEAARIVGLTVGTLQTYRKFRKAGRSAFIGPEYIKLGSAVFYTRAALEAYCAGPGA